MGGCVVALLGLARVASAQIVNVQALLEDEPEPGVSGKVEASGDWRTGNTRLLRVGAAAALQYACGPHRGFAIVRGDYGQSGSPLTKYLSKTFEHVRYRWSASPRWTAEVFAQNEADEFRRLRLRALAGAGPRLTVASADELTAHVGVAYMFEYELRPDDGGADSGRGSAAHRVSSYVTGAYARDPKVRVHATAYVQPRLDAPRDLRVLIEAGLTVALSSSISYKTAFTLGHDSRPPDGTNRTDTALQSALSLAF